MTSPVPALLILAALYAALYAIDAPRALAHGALHEQIEQLTRSLKTDPDNAALLLKRGQLYSHHAEPANAIADLERALKLDPKLTEARFHHARTLHEAGRTAEARASVDQFLAAKPGDPLGLLLRARIRTKQNDAKGAAEDYTLALPKLELDLPDVYLERAREQARSTGPEDAIAGLDEGIRRLGKLDSLELLAIELEQKIGRTDQALARVEAKLRTAPRKDLWLCRKGRILEAAKREGDAREAFAACQKELGRLTDRQRRQPEAQELARLLEGKKLAEPESRLEKQTREILQAPDNPSLYLKRAEQHVQEKHWDQAIRDYDKAAELGAKNKELHLDRAETFLKAGKPASAIEASRLFSKAYPDDPRGPVVRARALMRQGKPSEAVAEYTAGLERGYEPAPDLYLERMEAQKKSGKSTPATRLEGIDEGLRKLGPVLTLQLKAIDLELELGRAESALARIDTILAQSERKEAWLERRADVLMLLKRTEEARAAREQALAAVKALPPGPRKSPETRALQARLEKKLTSGARRKGEPAPGPARPE